MENYITIKEAAAKWDVSTRRVQILCNEGRIEGAMKFGRDWAIPVEAKKPRDQRITSGNYINWRKSKINKRQSEIAS